MAAGLGLARGAVDHRAGDGGQGRQQQKSRSEPNLRQPHAWTTFMGLPHSPQNFSSFSNLAPQEGQTKPVWRSCVQRRAFWAAFGAAALAGTNPFSAIRAFSRSTSASTQASSFCRSFLVL